MLQTLSVLKWLGEDTGCLDNVLPVDAIGCHIPRGSNKNGNTITINIVYTS